MASPETTTIDLAGKIAAARAELAELQRLAREAKAATKPEPRRIRFTKSTVKALPVPSAGVVNWWDTDVTGLGVRVSESGRKTYFLQARTKAGRAVKITLGRADRITGEQARDAAGKHLAAIELGRDPAAELRCARKAERDRRKAATIDQAWQAFEKDHLVGKRSKTQTAYRGWYARHIKPVIGRTKIADLPRDRVKQLHRDVTEATGQSTANRTLAVLSSVLSYAVDHELVAANVAKGISRHKEPGRERSLTDTELKSLIVHLDASPDLEARVCELLLATGARRGEVLTMRWTDLFGSWWTVPATVSKSRKAVRRPLNEAALEVLGKVDRKGALVFQGTSEGKLSKWWQAARHQLGLGDLHLHDLRHASASLALNAGIPLAAVGKMLGHGVHSAAMTARYSHIGDKQLAAASAAVAERLEMLRKAPAAGSA